MKTIDSPKELEWFEGELPSAELCHYDARIITMHLNGDYVDSSFLKPHPVIVGYWIDDHNKVFAPSKYHFTKYYWAWYRKF